MAQRKPYNPNTKYGRQKLREQADKNLANMPPEKRAKAQSNAFLILIVIVIIVFLIFLASGNLQGFSKWATR